MRYISIKQQLSYLIGIAFILSVVIGAFQVRSSNTVSEGLRPTASKFVMENTIEPRLAA
ncbi:MAG: hypothetical protein WCI55_10235 [Armatimonadota bacterium]